MARPRSSQPGGHAELRHSFLISMDCPQQSADFVVLQPDQVQQRVGSGMESEYLVLARMTGRARSATVVPDRLIIGRSLAPSPTAGFQAFHRLGMCGIHGRAYADERSTVTTREGSRYAPTPWTASVSACTSHSAVCFLNLGVYADESMDYFLYPLRRDSFLPSAHQSIRYFLSTGLKAASGGRP